MSILNILNQISNESSTKTKLQILEDNKDNELLKQVCYLTYNPNINFYIKKIPLYETKASVHIIMQEAFVYLEELSTRKWTGNNAVEGLEAILRRLSNDDEEVVKRIIKRDLRCGLGTTLINKVWKDLIPKYPYQRISLFKDIKPNTINWENGVYSQLKEDSMYANLNYIDKDNIELTSRTGSVFPIEKFSNIVIDTVVNLVEGNQYHGELQVERDGVILQREIGNGILNSVLKGGDFADNEKPVYHVWDFVPLKILAPKCKFNKPYSERYDFLKELLVTDRVDHDEIDIKLVETRICYSIDEVIEHYTEVRKKGLEGLVIKLPSAIWRDGTSKEMFKLKQEVDVDLVVIGYNDGNGRNEKTFGSLICESSDGLLEVGVSGFTDEKRLDIYNNIDKYIGKVITIRSNEITEPTKNNTKYSLFLPRFIEFRDSDKDIADDLEEIINQFESSILTIKEMFDGK